MPEETCKSALYVGQEYAAWRTKAERRLVDYEKIRPAKALQMSLFNRPIRTRTLLRNLNKRKFNASDEYQTARKKASAISAFRDEGSK